MKKVIVVGPKSEDTFEWHIKTTLVRMGIETDLIDLYSSNSLTRKTTINLQYFGKFPKYLQNKFIKKVAAGLYDTIIVCYRNFPPEIIKALKGIGVRTIHINPDTITTLNRQDIFVEKYDYYFSKSDYMVNFMREKLGLNTFKYLEAFNPHHLVSDYKTKYEAEESEKIDVMLYGSFYPAKNRSILDLDSKNELGIKLFGVKGFYFDNNLNSRFTGEYLIGKNKANKIYGSKVVFNNLLYGEIDSLNCRFFEVIGSGGVQVVDDKLDLRKIYSKDYIDYISFNSTSEATKKIKNILSSAELRNELSLYNLELAKAYTYELMLEKVMDIVN